MLFIDRDDLDAISGRDRAIPLDNATVGSLTFTRGASNVALRPTRNPGLLCRLAFTGRLPEVTTNGNGAVTVAYPRVFHPLDWKKHGVTGTLSEAIPWTLAFRGGLSRLDADLASLHLEGVTVDGGASEVRISLPAPVGVVPIRINGGASKMELIRPAGVPLTIDVGSGASDVRVDEQRFGAMAGPITLVAGTDAGAPDRYELRIAGGASQLTVREEPS